MTRLVRKLEQKIWLDKEIAKKEGWLKDGAVCADALRNLKTSDNKLSVFSLRQDSDLLRIVSALVASPRGISVPDSDYVVFDQSLIDELGIETELTKGKTLDVEVNELHIDLTKLSGEKIVRFAEKLQDCGQIGRFRKKEVAKTLSQLLTTGVLHESALSKDLLESIRKHS